MPWRGLYTRELARKVENFLVGESARGSRGREHLGEVNPATAMHLLKRFEGFESIFRELDILRERSEEFLLRFLFLSKWVVTHPRTP